LRGGGILARRPCIAAESSLACAPPSRIDRAPA
jgi:hypothetical protein